jgi:sec-independent protein translocase protein TatA
LELTGRPRRRCGAFTGISFWELVLILIIALVVFGPKKLPEMGKALGASLREFKKATQAITDDVKQAVAEDVHAANKVEPPKVAAPKQDNPKPDQQA